MSESKKAKTGPIRSLLTGIVESPARSRTLLSRCTRDAERARKAAATIIVEEENERKLEIEATSNRVGEKNGNLFCWAFPYM